MRETRQKYCWELTLPRSSVETQSFSEASSAIAANRSGSEGCELFGRAEASLHLFESSIHFEAEFKQGVAVDGHGGQFPTGGGR